MTAQVRLVASTAHLFLPAFSKEVHTTFMSHAFSLADTCSDAEMFTAPAACSPVSRRGLPEIFLPSSGDESMSPPVDILAAFGGLQTIERAFLLLDFSLFLFFRFYLFVGLCRYRIKFLRSPFARGSEQVHCFRKRSRSSLHVRKASSISAHAQPQISPTGVCSSAAIKFAHHRARSVEYQHPFTKERQDARER